MYYACAIACPYLRDTPYLKFAIGIHESRPVGEKLSNCDKGSVTIGGLLLTAAASSTAPAEASTWKRKAPILRKLFAVYEGERQVHAHAYTFRRTLPHEVDAEALFKENGKTS